MSSWSISTRTVAPGVLRPVGVEEPTAPESVVPAGTFGSAGMTMDSESGDGMMDGLWRCSRVAALTPILGVRAAPCLIFT